MVAIGCFLVAVLFAWAAYGHIKNAKAMAGYASTAYGDCPVAPQLSYLSGWPTGLYLVATAVGVFLQTTWGLWLAIGFLAATQLLFHRKLNDPVTWKHLALIGALLALVAGQ